MHPLWFQCKSKFHTSDVESNQSAYPNAGAAVLATVPKEDPKANLFPVWPKRPICWFGGGWPNALVVPAAAPKAGAGLAPKAGVVEPKSPPLGWGAAAPKGLLLQQKLSMKNVFRRNDLKIKWDGGGINRLE